MTDFLPEGIELKTPLTREVTRKLKAGDVVYITGHMFGGAEEFFTKIVDEGKPCPFDNKKYNVLGIGGGRVKKVGDKMLPMDSNEPIVTTGVRYLRWIPNLIRRLEIKAVATKGGLGTHEETIEACKEMNCVALTLFAPPPKLRSGAAFGIEAAYWPRVILPDRASYDVVVYKEDRWGPVIVNIDTRGNSFLGQIDEKVDKNKLKIYKRIGIPADYKYFEVE